MINVGCKFGPNDLSAETWRELVWFEQEKQWLDDKLSKHRETLAKKTVAEKQAIDRQRQELGISPPGQSLFPPAPKGRGK